ncbi:serine/threonine-protein phosphatase 4 regulatory subunit 4-like isoform X2 [Venturia canescens]|uniref:serine/threonine-protein phosphatase 4 regulatory subunit 4-like isoform X2 n=1 Tax=Venturia canescens TaxID=32260 RepID=UPI001C9C43BC|nr:serine/threonine-protein phosphatase 4 regulatory subunit 4-like isoform X2 [Venturia canescens]
MWQEGGEAPFESTSDTKGEDIQKLSVIQTLPSLLAGDAQSCISRLMPKMQQTLPTASTEFHMAASTTFKTILEQRLVSHSTFTQTFLQSILNSLDSRDPVVAQAWLETLLDVIELLPAEVIRQEILPMAINKGQLSQPTSSRITCSKLIGKICTRFDSQLIKKEVLPTVHSLCQDVNSDVRACICLQLRYVAEGLGPESVKPALLPSIVELASDEECSVRHASVQTIVHLLPQLQTDVIKNTIAPLIKKLCEGALESDDTVLCVIAQEFGKLALGLEKCLTPGEKTWLIQYFQQLSQLGVPSMRNEGTKQEFPFISNNPLINERNVECRWQCAFNIPAMFLFVSSAAEDVEILLPTFNDLASDPYYMVRRTIACGIHEVARILGPRNNLIKGELIKLLKDDSDEVLQGLVPHVAVTFELLLQSQTIGMDKIDSTAMDLVRALLKCEAEIDTTNNWRLSALMLEQMEVLPKCFPSDIIYTYFVPVVVTRALKARPMPVRLAAGRTFLVLLRHNLKPTHRTALRNRLYTEFAWSSNSYVRMLYIHMMIEAMEIFSSMYFKEYFYSAVLALTEDPIANVRLKVVTLLPSLKSFIRLPSDKELLSSLEANVRKLMNNETDRDVVYALTNVIHKLDAIVVRHEGQPTSAKMSKQETDDLRKYEEEKRLMNTTAGKSVLSSSQLAHPTPTAAKKHLMTPKISGTNRMASSEMGIGRGVRQNPIPTDGARSSLPPNMSKVKPPGSISMPDPPSRLSRQNLPASRLNEMPKASSMPEIPVTLQDDEFLVDAGIRMPVQLSSCHPSSRIPKLQEIIYRNRRVVGQNAERSCSSERPPSVNLDKGKSKRHFSMHEDCLKTRSSSLDQTKINRCSVNYEDMARQRGKCSLEEQHCVKDDPRSKRYPAPPGKLRMSCGEQQKSKSFEDKSKRCSLILDKEKSRFSQPKSVIDRTKRHSVNYTTHVTDIKDTKPQKFKRHSLEVTESNGSERMGRLKRNFTLDVNHNQGASKISSLRSALASGSRTAPVTRASSPIRVAPRFNFDRQVQDDIGDYSMERQLGKFSSSDEEVDKLCIRFSYLDPPNIRDDRASSRASRLPVWMRRKKP